MATTMPYVPLAVSQADVTYLHGPDSSRKREVPGGIIDELFFDESSGYPGTSRSIWVHYPSELRAGDEAAVMFFNDGWWYLDPEGDVRAGIVLDNLAAEGAIPPMIAVFVDPGVLQAEGEPTKNRNAEYDGFDGRYAGFLLDEVLPMVSERFATSPDPAMRGICGGSSGGNAAFTAAWTRPDGFGRVIGFNSSFVQMPGGNPYPPLIGAEATKPLRIFLHAAHWDLNWNAPEENWFSENLKTAAALAEAGYDMRLVVGDGGHSPNHGGVLLPDALRWLWRDAARA